MSEPIVLTKGDDTLTVYGKSEAARQTKNGWKSYGKNVFDTLPPLADEPKAESVKEIQDLASLDIDELKAIADEMGVSYTWNIKPETLRKRIKKAGA